MRPEKSEKVYHLYPHRHLHHFSDPSASAQSIHKIADPPHPEQKHHHYWQSVSDRIHHRTVDAYVNKFIYKIKQLPIKHTPPDQVRLKLEGRLKYKPFWEESSEGWSLFRLDVMINTFLQLGFNIVAIFLYTSHLVLSNANIGIFPLIYIAAVCVSALYKCCTKIQQYEHLVLTKKQLVINYLKFHFLLDIGLIVLSTLEYLGVDSGVFRFIAFFRLFDCMVAVKRIKIYLDVIKYASIIWDLLSIYLLNIFIDHVVALIFIEMASDEANNWMLAFGLSSSQEQWGFVYIKAFYWAATTLMCSSFGDVVPITNKETLIVTGVEIVGLSLLAFWIGNIQSLMSELREYQKSKRRNLSTINRLMSNNQVPHKIQREVKQQVLSMSKSLRIKQVEEQNELVEQMAPEIKRRLLQAIHHKLLTFMSLWNRMPTYIVKKIASLLERKLYYSGQSILTQGDIPERYFMLGFGEIEQRFHRGKSHSKIGSIGDKNSVLMRFRRMVGNNPRKYQWLGLKQSILQQKSACSIYSSGESLIVSIGCIEVVNELHHKSYEAYCAFRDQLLLVDSNVQEQQCHLCPKQSHSLLECPYYHYIPTPQLVKNRYLRSLTLQQFHQKRRPVRRRQGVQTRNRVISRILRPVLGTLVWNYGQKYLNVGEWQKKLHHAEQSRLKFNEGLFDTKIDNYLTTIQECDVVHKWKLYHPRFNLK